MADWRKIEAQLRKIINDIKQSKEKKSKTEIWLRLTTYLGLFFIFNLSYYYLHNRLFQ